MVRCEFVKNVLPALFAILFFFLSTLATVAQTRNNFDDVLRQQIVTELEKFVEGRGLTSLSFSLFSADSGFEHAIGYADRSRKIKTTPDHIYTIASVTKSITAMVTVNLLRQKGYSLNESVQTIIPGFPPNVTILDLLNHTSGFHREKENENYLVASNYNDVLDYLPVKFKLKIHRYANFNYAAVGALVETIADKPFREVASDYYRSVTGKGLHFHNRTNGLTNPFFVKNYVKKRRRIYEHDVIDFGLWEPAAFAQTSAKSLAAFLQHHMTAEMINFIESHAVMIKTRNSGGDSEHKVGYSLGFRIRYVDGELKHIFHNGFLYGVLATIYYFPQRGIGFVALSNMSSYPGQNITLGGLYKRIERAIDRSFNLKIARYAAKNGYVAGTIYYETNKHEGELRQEMMAELGREYSETGQHQAALNLFKLNNHVFSGIPSTYSDLAQAYRRIGKHPMAREIMRRGSAITAEDEREHPALGGFGSPEENK